jgi:5'-nucleotidase
MILLLDMDGVLADFEGGFVRAWTARYPDVPPLPPGDRRHFSIRFDYPEHQGELVQAVYHAEGFFRDLTPLPGALEAVGELAAMGHDLRICTSPLRQYRYCVAEKYEWIDAHLGPEFVNRMIVTRDKTLVRGDVLVDDNPAIAGAHTPEWRHVVFDQPYNRQVAGPRMTWADWRNVLTP